MSIGVKSAAAGVWVATWLGLKGIEYFICDKGYDKRIDVPAKMFGWHAIDIASWNALMLFIGCGIMNAIEGDKSLLGAVVAGAATGIGYVVYKESKKDDTRDDGEMANCLGDVIKGAFVGAAIFSIPFTR